MLRAVKRRIRYRWAQFGLLSAEMMIVTIAFFGSFIVFVSVAKAIFLDDKKEFDADVFDAIKPMIAPQTTSVMRTLSIFANHTFLIPANLALIAYFLFVQKHKWYSIKIPAIALSSTAIMFLMKSWFTRNRPEIPLLESAKGYSFPSGHAFMSFAFYGLLIYLTHKYVKNRPLKLSIIIALLIFIHLIGFSRIYLRVHYASDVIAGFCLGFMWLAISISILNKIERTTSNKFIAVKAGEQTVETVN